MQRIFIVAPATLALASLSQAQFSDVERFVSTFAQSYHEATDKAETNSDGAQNFDFGVFEVDLTSTATPWFNSVEARAIQESDLFLAGRSFEAQGAAVGSIYVQGTGLSLASSSFSVELVLPTPGQVVFSDLALRVDDSFEGSFAQDRPGDANVRVAIEPLPGGSPLAEWSLALDDVGTLEELDASGTSIGLAAGRYRLVISATVNDTTQGIEQVEYGLAAAMFSVAGWIDLEGPAGFYCFSDACPCANSTELGGCRNSTGQGGQLAITGSNSLAADDMQLIAQSLPAGQPGLFYLGGAASSSPFGDGERCVAPGATGICRLPIRTTASDGNLTEGTGWLSLAQSLGCPLSAGSTWYLQAWYRDPAGPCGQAFNLTNAAAILLQP